MPATSPIILHHFEQSPFSEKIRLIFGLKKLAWCSVLISRIMPRPDLMPMTGGYRRTPVMQIGADIYCDTQCIMRELERRFPEPSLLPRGHDGLVWGTAMWTDRSFFQNTVNLVFGSLADKVPAEFIADREKLRGAKFDIAAMTAAIPQMRDQFRAHLQWIDTQLGDERPWLAGDAPSLLDVNARISTMPTRCSPSSTTPARGPAGCARAATASAPRCHQPKLLSSPPRQRRRPRNCTIPTIPTAARSATGSRSCPTTTARSVSAARSSRCRRSTSRSAAATRAPAKWSCISRAPDSSSSPPDVSPA
jgi:glutathione S-transferase